MNDNGISISEACAKRAAEGNGYLTDEDFARQCNPDGTLIQKAETMTFSIKDSDSSFTISAAHMYIGGAIVIVLLVLAAILLGRRRKKANETA